jgi:hypothetical protein
MNYNTVPEKKSVSILKQKGKEARTHLGPIGKMIVNP